jgi:nucleoside-diphosphate-sugar epimerase
LVEASLRALVTGAGGFLGQHIAEQLVRRGDQVWSFSRHEHPALAALGVQSLRGDVRDAVATAAACRGMDAVFHVAAVAGIWGPWKAYFQVNTLGTRHVLAGCLKGGVRRLVYTSSPSVTFTGEDQRGVDESVPYADRWLCHYPHSKALAEQEVLAANGRGELLTCALRPHLVWGPGDQHLIPRLVERARSGRLRRIGAGTNRIDMIHVENAAEAHLLAADALAEGSPVGGRAYFLSQGQPVNCWEWINEILALANAPAVRRWLSLRTAWYLGLALESVHGLLRLRREPRMTRFLAAQLARCHYFDIRRARTDLQYRPTIGTSEGMEQLGRWLSAAAR